MAPWDIDWAWSLPLIVLTVLIQVVGLGMINERIAARADTGVSRPWPMAWVIVVLAAATLIATVLLAINGTIWALAYRVLGALPDNRSAMLYSLSAITGYGHAPIFLEPHWQMMGALEALNGVMLFGVTTAFLITMIQKIWPLGSRRHGRRD
jgi:hypothetical protein